MKTPIRAIITLFACFLLMLCLGGVYAWSMHVPAMKAQIGLSTREAQMIIGGAIAIFSLSLLLTGKAEYKLGSRTLAVFSVVLIVLGYELAGLLGRSFGLLFFFLSVIVGLGTASGYAVCLSVPGRLFPRHRGLALGISVSGFGAGAILHAYAYQLLAGQDEHYSILSIWKWLGIMYGILGLLSFYFIHSPGYQQVVLSEKKVFSWLDKNFLVLFATMFFGSVAGILLVSNINPLALSKGYDMPTAALAVSVYAIGNSGGRIFWGWISDKIGAVKSLTLAYTVLIFGVLGIYATPTSFWFLLAVFLAASGYAASFSLFPVRTTQWVGAANLGLVYPKVFLGYGLAGFTGPAVAGALFDYTNSYDTALLLALAAGIMALVLNNTKLHMKPYTQTQL